MSAKRLRLHDASGASAVEFALVAPILLVFIFGIFELGWGLYCGSSVRWALETSARTLLLTPTTTQTDLRNSMLSLLSNVPNASSVTVTLVTDTSTPNAKVLKASSAYTFPMSVPMLPTYDLQFNSSVAVPAP